MARHYRPIPPSAIRVAVPDTTQQTDYSCGASSLQAIAKHYGVGPDCEPDFVRDTGMDHRIGSHPDQIIKAASKYGLKCRLYQPMTLAQLQRELDLRHPVMLMIQAWGLERRSYRNVWIDGHWVVAIGYDREVVYFEDPSLQAVRGYLRNEELEERWHDTARHGRHVEHLGLAIWLPGARGSRYASRSQRIE